MITIKKENVLLEVQDLKTYFFTSNGVIPSVDGITFEIKEGETVAIVGESGCGKSITSLSIMGLVSSPGKIVGGAIYFEGKNLLKASKKEMRAIRGNKISMIFQEPMTSLNPVLTIGFQISEALRLHQNLTRKEAKEKAIQLLHKVGIPRAEKIYSSYPHSLSGGMRQRVMIAMALSCNPKLLIADEPTTALDVSIQAQILELMKQLTKEYNTAIMLITHDLGVVAGMVDRVIVMYAGQIVEQADVYTIFKSPKHPYTQGLIESTPSIFDKRDELLTIDGQVPNPFQMPKGCRFQPRCKYALPECSQQMPELCMVGEGHGVRCFLHQGMESENT